MILIAMAMIKVAWNFP